MKALKFSILLIWVLMEGIDAELTLEVVYQEVTDLKLEVAALKVENSELRADVKFLMDQNSVLVEHFASKSTETSDEETLDVSFAGRIAGINSEQSIIPEVSTLMANFNELFKMTRDKAGNGIE